MARSPLRSTDPYTDPYTEPYLTLPPHGKVSFEEYMDTLCPEGWSVEQPQEDASS